MSQPYVVDHKRGEVNELKALLRNERVVRDPAKKREVIKKVIAYMTLGIDVSRLFSEMIMACHTKDLVQKKMVYLYLCTYAEQKADLAILAINTLHKDVRDEDPMVRGLALRSLCSLRLPNIVEYALQPIRQRLNDPSPYVRKTAVLGVAKLFSRHPEVVKGKESDLVDVLYNMLRDKDAQVVTNVVSALNEVLADEGEMAINAPIIMHLLNRLSEFSEWGQCAVLALVGRYTPANDKEMFDIMNVLEERLRHSNSAVVLGVTKVFLNFTMNNSQLHLQVYQRLKAPLLTLMTSGNFELAFCVLGHVKLLVDRAPGVFDDDFKHLFCRYNDPTCVKLLKLDILQNLANQKNFSDLLNEFGEYVTDVDAEIARKAIQGIAFIAVKVETAVDEAIESLLSFLDLNMDYVTAEACIVMKNLLRKYPERYPEVIPALQKCLKTIDEEEGKVAVIWMIGEYGDTIKDAPYILEPLIDNFADEPSHAVRTQLLSSAMKLFFKRPPELKHMLGKLLKAAVEDTSQIDVRDRALLYYRLLKYDVHEAARVVNGTKVIVDSFVEQEDQLVKEQIFKEFNSLSLVYHKPAKLFVTGVDMEEELKREEAARKKKAAEDQQENSASSSLVRDQDRDADAPVESEKDIVKVPKIQPKPQSEIDILAMDLLDMPGGKAFSPGPSQPVLNLNSQVAMDGATFQNKWGSIPVGGTFELSLSSPNLDTGVMESTLALRSVMTMASGIVDGIIKLYLYAQSMEGDYFFVETVIDSRTGRLTATVKTDTRGNAQELSVPFITILKEAFTTL